MPWSLTRFQQARCLHFITFSCQHRDPESFRELVREVKIPTLSHKTRQGWGTLTISF
jgi:hypothetical protein